MKVVAKKKTIVILIVCFIFLLLSGLGLLFRDRIIQIIKTKSFDTFDKYSELVEDCEIEKKEGEVILHCKGLLKNVSNEEEQDCINIELLIDNDTDLRATSLCIKKGGLDWEDPYKKAFWYIPVDIKLIYKALDVADLSLSSIVLHTTHDDEIKSFFEQNLNLKSLRNKILTKDVNSMIENNYSISEKVIINNNKIHRISFYKLLLKSVSVVNSKLELIFETIIRGQRYNITFYSSKLLHEDHKTGVITLLTPEGYSELKIGNSYFMLAKSSSYILPESINDYCFTMQDILPTERTEVQNNLFSKELFAFCTVKPKNLSDMYIPDIEDYISSSIKEAEIKEDGRITLKKITPFIIIPF